MECISVFLDKRKITDIWWERTSVSRNPGMRHITYIIFYSSS